MDSIYIRILRFTNQPKICSNLAHKLEEGMDDNNDKVLNDYSFARVNNNYNVTDGSQ